MAKQYRIDKLVGYFSPTREAQRLRARIINDRLRKLQLSYDGASTSRRTDGWTALSTDANEEIAGALSKLRNRSRELVRNNPYAKRAFRSLANNVVGPGIIPQAMHPSNDKIKRVYDDLWIEWGDSTDCDADGMMDFYGLQQLAVKTIFQAGEVLIRRRRRFSSDGLAVPMQLQILEPDFIDSFRDGDGDNGNKIIQGIEFNAIGRRVAYWLFDEHPGGRYSGLRGYRSRRVPAEDIQHLYFVERPGQVRGVPETAPILIRLRDFDDYEDASLIRQKIAACFTAFVVESDLPETALGGVESDNSDDFGKVEPGLIERLPPGKDIRFGNPPTNDGAAEFSRTKLQGVAAGLDLTYEMVTGDLSNVNFSSGRMGWLEFQRAATTWQWQLLVPQMCKPTWRWFTESAQIAGLASGPATASWTPPRREMIDPVKETNAMKAQIRSGLITLSEAIRQLGYDPKAVLEERKLDNDLLDSLGIILDSDPRAVQGQIAAQTSGDSDSDDDQNDE